MLMLSGDSSHRPDCPRIPFAAAWRSYPCSAIRWMKSEARSRAWPALSSLVLPRAWLRMSKSRRRPRISWTYSTAWLIYSTAICGPIDSELSLTVLLTRTRLSPDVPGTE